LLKVKQFVDEEFLIVGAEENKGRQKGQCTFICKTADGKEFKAKPMGTDETRRAYWENKDKYIGKHLTVRYFERTEGGVPRFPVGVEVRDYE
jgi:DNA ligase-1